MLPVIACGIAALGLWNALKVPVVTEVTLVYENLPRELDGYRIVQISDLHACAAARGWRTRAIVEKANALNPDLICLTGDVADGSPSDRYVDVMPLKELRAKDGIFAVSGNHEAFYGYAVPGLHFHFAISPRPKSSSCVWRRHRRWAATLIELGMNAKNSLGFGLPWFQRCDILRVHPDR